MHLLTARPADVIKLIYDFIEEEPFEHDFENVIYDAPEFDTQLGLKDLHTVKPKVKPQKRKTILPPDLFEKFSGMAFWHDLKNSKAFRITATPTENKDNNQPA